VTNRQPLETVRNADGVAVGLIAAPTAADRAMLAGILKRYAADYAAGAVGIVGPYGTWRVSDRH
jgi:nicotinamide mononucleotide (NMN) deamidase PncC